MSRRTIAGSWCERRKARRGLHPPGLSTFALGVPTWIGTPSLSLDLGQLTGPSTEVERRRRGIVPDRVEERQRPVIDLAGLEDGFAEHRRREAVGARMCGEPDQVPVPLDERPLGRSAPPGAVLFDISVARR